MELITLENNKPIVELRKISEVFNKNHYDLLKQCEQLIGQAVELEEDILKTTYTDSRGRSKPTYHLTQKGFSILCMGFNGKKALAWKIKFYDAFEQMKAENTLHNQYLQLLNNKWDNTVCITDICCKFKDLEPTRANQLLQNAGMIEHRASGWYPSLNYNGSDMLVSATAVNPYTNKLDNYVRYTPKGYKYVYNYMIENGEELLK